MTIGAIALVVSTCCVFACGAMMPVITSGAENVVGGAIAPLIIALVFTGVGWFSSWRSLKDNSSRAWGVAAVILAFVAAYWTHYMFYAMQISIGL